MKHILRTTILLLLLSLAAWAQTYGIENDCFGWVDDTTHTLLSEAARSNDRKLINQLIIQGKVLLLNKGDVVTVTDMGFLSHTVYVRSGNNAGKTCIINSESLGDRR